MHSIFLIRKAWPGFLSPITPSWLLAVYAASMALGRRAGHNSFSRDCLPSLELPSSLLPLFLSLWALTHNASGPLPLLITFWRCLPCPRSNLTSWVPQRLKLHWDQPCFTTQEKCYRLDVVCPLQNSCGNLVPKVTILRGSGTFKRYLGNRGPMRMKGLRLFLLQMLLAPLL
jgi:hypothetical protein